MKIKRFNEGVAGETFWLFDYFIKDNLDHNYKLFPNLESVHLYTLDIINEERKVLEDVDYTEDMFFTDIDKATKWYEEIFDDIKFDWQEIKLEREYKLDKDIKKYNL